MSDIIELDSANTEYKKKIQKSECQLVCLKHHVSVFQLSWADDIQILPDWNQF